MSQLDSVKAADFITRKFLQQPDGEFTPAWADPRLRTTTSDLPGCPGIKTRKIRGFPHAIKTGEVDSAHARTHPDDSATVAKLTKLSCVVVLAGRGRQQFKLVTRCESGLGTRPRLIGTDHRPSSAACLSSPGACRRTSSKVPRASIRPFSR